MTNSSNQTRALRAGQTIGNYCILSELGRGGMGVVYLARHTVLERKVALKTLLPDKVGSARIDRFLKEARLCSQIHHPNVVDIHDAGVIGDIYYLVMQHVDGMNLREVALEQGGPLPWRVALKVMRLAVRGTAALHAKGMIHRDIKPSNIMVAGDGRQVLLMDFGLAREEHSSDLTETGMIVGTPHFMSPEQCIGDQIDKRSDIFSLGSTLYFLLTAKLPYPGKLHTAIRDISSGKSPVPVHQENPFVPPEVSGLVAKAMAHDPAKRFQRAEDMASEIADLIRLPVLSETGSWETHDNSAEKTSERVREILAPLELLPSETVVPSEVHRWGIPVVTILAFLALGAVMWLLESRAPPGKRAIQQAATSASTHSDSGSPDAMGNRLESLPPLASDMVAIPAGFVSTSNSEEKLRRYFEAIPGIQAAEVAFALQRREPDGRVWVPGFHIDRFETTNAEYAAFVKAENHPPPVHWNGVIPPAGYENHPVTNVSFEDASAYAAWAKKKLPTWHQWLRAFRGETETLFPWDDRWDPQRANVAENAAVPKNTTAVAATPNDLSTRGVRNLVGNVRELLGEFRPVNGQSVVMIVGGNWNQMGAYYGVGSVPGYVLTNNKDPMTGFRCVRETP